MFNFFSSNFDMHHKRMVELLREAQVNRIEHQASAEHHAALARMYSERVERLQGEIQDAMAGLSGLSVRQIDPRIAIDNGTRPADSSARSRLSAL